MYNRFANTSNVKRFMNGIVAVNARGAAEASLMLCSGDAGHGKSRTSQWWATQNNAVFIRIKAAATPHWFLTDLVRELGETAPAHSCEKLFGQAVGILVQRAQPIVVDEVEAALHDMRVIETIRDLSDTAEVPVVLSGREYVQGHLKRHPQIWSRISALVVFQSISEEDVAICARELSEVPVADDVVKAIHQGADGRIRNVINALAIAERVGKRQAGKPVTMDALKGTALFKEFHASRRVAPVAKEVAA